MNGQSICQLAVAVLMPSHPTGPTWSDTRTKTLDTEDLMKMHKKGCWNLLTIAYTVAYISVHSSNSTCCHPKCSFGVCQLLHIILHGSDSKATFICTCFLKIKMARSYSSSADSSSSAQSDKATIRRLLQQLNKGRVMHKHHRPTCWQKPI